MIKHYRDYFWKKGKPCGKGAASPLDLVSYKIISDPYYKRFSIEKYEEGKFKTIIYDSIFLDFRHLNLLEHMAWQRESLLEESNQTQSLLRNQDDRIILIETQYFEKDRCRLCTLHSIHGVFISSHHMYYKALKDPFNGVILYDIEKRPIIIKSYQTDPDTGEFTQLLKEEWDMGPPSSLTNLSLEFFVLWTASSLSKPKDEKTQIIKESSAWQSFSV